MKRFGSVTGLAILLAGSFATSEGAMAQTMAADIGEFEFMNSCASCHGADGKGAGPLADMLSVAPADLTQLQKNNGGVFPVSAAYSMIEGSTDVGAHGSREMPVWGLRYEERAESDPDFGPEAMEAYPRLRILALVEYLSTIQE